jgi:hypothetical protein
MPLLYYWRGDNYRRDLDMGAGYHLNQANPKLHQSELGDSLWAFTRNKDGRYVLAAELIIKAKTDNPPNFRYGRYRVWGDINLSRYFVVDNQPSVEQIIRQLSCKTNARILGRSFQGGAAVKPLTIEDHQILVAAAQNLPIEPRARILPEEKLEAGLLLGDSDKISQLIKQEPHGIAEARQKYLYQQAPNRTPQLVANLHALYHGRCQICLWNPVDIYGNTLCHGHHVHWLSRGGEDSMENLMLVCPNHHAAIHKLDAPLDYKDFSFDFRTHREPVQLDYHLRI